MHLIKFTSIIIHVVQQNLCGKWSIFDNIISDLLVQNLFLVLKETFLRKNFNKQKEQMLRKTKNGANVNLQLPDPFFMNDQTMAQTWPIGSKL